VLVIKVIKDIQKNNDVIIFFIGFSNTLNIFWHSQKTRGSSAAKKKIAYHEAKMYLNEIKDAFKDEKHKYYEFLRVLKDFEKRRFDLFILGEKFFNL